MENRYDIVFFGKFLAEAGNRAGEINSKKKKRISHF